MVTATRRLSRALHQSYERRCLGRATIAWRTPDALPWNAWLERQWSEAREQARVALPALLQTEQELALWEAIIAEQAPALMRPREAARGARQAWQTLHHYGFDLTALREPLDPDSRAFTAWAKAYSALTANKNWIEPARALTRLVALVAGGELTETVPGYVFAGFDTLVPVQVKLRDALMSAGVRVDGDASAHTRFPAAGVCRVQCASPYDEVVAAARWARATVEGRAEPVSVAIVVPDLASRRGQVLRVLEQVLDPPARRPQGALRDPSFELSLGEPLSVAPPVADALRLLDLTAGRVPLAQAGALLRSAYLPFGGASASVKARLDARLRTLGEATVDIGMMAALAPVSSEADRDAALTVAQACMQLHRQAQFGAAPVAAGQWAERFGQLLETAGWPGTHGLDSVEHQQVEAFHALLEEFSRHSAMRTHMNLRQALERLRELACSRMHQAGEVNDGGCASVQILGVLETAGLRFDATWVCGLDARAWPREPSPSAFLPFALQRAAAMPGADLHTSLEQAQAVMHRLAASAPTVVFSCAINVDGDARLPSSTVIELPLAALDDLLPASEWLHPWARTRVSAPTMLVLSDPNGPALGAGELSRGGAGVFGDQAACPFRTFAVHRLASTSVQAPASAADSRLRGQLVHRVLDRLWATLGGRAALAKLSDAQRLAQITTVVEAVLASETRARTMTFGAHLRALESSRLVRLVDRWLRLELERSDFEVMELEKTRTVTVGGVPVRLRPDRVDRLPGGGLLVIDYKTGRSGVNSWFGERPEDPQLPVYALALGRSDGPAGLAPEPVMGISFGLLGQDQLSFKGLAACADVAPGIAEFGSKTARNAPEIDSWETALQTWRGCIDALGQAVSNGVAPVDPKSRKACRYCEQAGLCRINWNERGTDLIDDDDDGPAAPGGDLA